MFGLIGKACAIVAIGLLVFMMVRWNEDRPLRKFCDSQSVGISRGSVAQRARAAGLLVSRDEKKDYVTLASHIMTRSMCVLSHDGTAVTRSRFVSE